MTGVLLAAFLATAPALVASEGRIAVYDTSGISAAGSYYLTREISGGFTISASDVFLDLNGFTIGGKLTISGSSSRARIRVANGKIRGGVDAQDIQGLILNDLAVSSQLVLTDCNKATVERCATESIELYGCLSTRVAQNTNFKGNGILLGPSSGSLCRDVEVVDNTVEFSTASGIELHAASGCTVARNVVHESQQNGIFLRASLPDLATGNRIAQNTVTGNLIAGIALTQSPQNQVTLNVVTGNGTENPTGAGIYLANSPSNEVSRNTVGGNGPLGGINLSSYSSYCNIHHNTVNSHTSPASSGIVVAGDHNSVDWNISSYNATYGFQVTGTGNVLSHNRALGNTVGAYFVGLGNTQVDYSGPAVGAYPTNF